MLDQYYSDKLDATQAKEKLQELTFYPMMFQAARVLLNSGILDLVFKNRKKGISATDISKELKLTHYGVNTLLENGLTVGLVYLKKDTKEVYTITKMGYILLTDRASQVNLHFTHDICYNALFHLDKSIENYEASGLKEIGIDDDTIYPHLSKLPEPLKTSWFDFDHYYSDNAFPTALKVIFDENPPKHMLDIGGNTGKWSMKCCEYNGDVDMTIVDLPGQVAKAKLNIAEHGLSDRIDCISQNILEKDLTLPNADAVWMSQFLDCFSEDQIEAILKNISNAMSENTTIYIMETFWDRQESPAAAYSLTATSLYFTAVANGNSKMYHSKDFYTIIEKLGLKVVQDIDKIGDFHTILALQKA